MRQLEGIGEKSIKVFSEKNINTLEDVRNSDSTRLEMIMNRNPPFGRNLIRQVSAFPRLKLSFEKVSSRNYPIGITDCYGYLDLRRSSSWCSGSSYN